VIGVPEDVSVDAIADPEFVDGVWVVPGVVVDPDVESDRTMTTWSLSRRRLPQLP
jgi:hypothetical protein